MPEAKYDPYLSSTSRMFYSEYNNVAGGLIGSGGDLKAALVGGVFSGLSAGFANEIGYGSLKFGANRNLIGLISITLFHLSTAFAQGGCLGYDIKTLNLGVIPT